MQLKATYKPQALPIDGISFETLEFFDSIATMPMANLPLSKCAWLQSCKAASLDAMGHLFTDTPVYGAILHVNQHVDFTPLLNGLRYLGSDEIFFIGESIENPAAFVCGIQTYYEIGCFFDYCLDLHRYREYLVKQKEPLISASLLHLDEHTTIDLTKVSMTLYSQRFKHKWLNVT